jgi:transcriptional regulator with XRE-family HTH domain
VAVAEHEAVSHPASPSAQLGAQLRQLRELKGQSLRVVADAAGFSPAYLLKLEQGSVTSPSPHVLRSLAEHYQVSYLSLMELAGYKTSDVPSEPRRMGVLAEALAAEPLTEEEQRAMAAFLTTLRAR